MDKLTPNDGASPDIAAGNIEKLREIFPEVFADGSVDFDALKQTLGSYVDDRGHLHSCRGFVLGRQSPRCRRQRPRGRFPAASLCFRRRCLGKPRRLVSVCPCGSAPCSQCSHGVGQPGFQCFDICIQHDLFGELRLFANRRLKACDFTFHFSTLSECLPPFIFALGG